MLLTQPSLTDPEDWAGGWFCRCQRKTAHRAHVAVRMLADFVNTFGPEFQREACLCLFRLAVEAKDARYVQRFRLHMFLFCSGAKESSPVTPGPAGATIF